MNDALPLVSIALAVLSAGSLTAYARLRRSYAQLQASVDASKQKGLAEEEPAKEPRAAESVQSVQSGPSPAADSRLNQLRLGVCTLNAEHRISQANEVFLRWIAATQADAIGKPLQCYIPDAANPNLTTGLSAAIESGQSPWFECALAGSDGTMMPVFALARLRKGEPSEAGIELILLHIDTQKREAQQKDRVARLESEFLANMSHELRTPLNAVLGMSEVLRDGFLGKLSEEQCNAAGTIYTAGRQLLALINDILDISMLQAGHFALQLAPVSVEELCRTALASIAKAADEQHISVEYVPYKRDLLINADPRRIQQCLDALLSNALKFNQEGGKVGLEVLRDRTKNEIILAVWDTGIGIKTEDQARIFEPFIQLDTGITRSYEGSGLGLSLARSLVELHGGTLHVQSTPGKGSRFEIVLANQEIRARGRMDSAAEISQPLEWMWPNRDTPLPASPLILIADDSASSVQPVLNYLEAKGYTAEVVTSGNAAVNFARQRVPALILMDIRLPGMNGLDATKLLRADTSVPRIPIIALTARAMPGDRELCLSAGADEYLTKPVELKALGEVLHRLVHFGRPVP